MLKKTPFVIAFFLEFAVSACTKAFNKKEWAEDVGELGGSDKVLMAEDLVKSHQLLGVNNRQLIQLLGSPTNYTDTTKTCYTLSEKYDMIDPISGKDLVIQFNKDSVIISAKIEEWHKP